MVRSTSHSVVVRAFRGVGLWAALLGLAQGAAAQTNITNSAPITINDNTTASPFPSSIIVEGLKRPIAHVAVTINNVSHTFMGDVGILLVGPGGQKVLLDGRCGGSGASAAATFTFDDTAATTFGTSFLSGTYRPSDWG